ncbi:hypothetical protein FW784_05615, partial [Lysobacter lacus]
MPAFLALVLAPALAAAASPPPSPFSFDECAVFERELSFARSVAEHDAAANALPDPVPEELKLERLARFMERQA